MTHFCSFKVTPTENTIWNGILPVGKSGQHYHPRQRRAVWCSIIRPQGARNALSLKRGHRSRRCRRPRPVFLKPCMRSLARWQRTAVARRQAVPVYRWCWVTFCEQSRVISRECRSAGIPQFNTESAKTRQARGLNRYKFALGADEPENVQIADGIDRAGNHIVVTNELICRLRGTTSGDKVCFCRKRKPNGSKSRLCARI